MIDFRSRIDLPSHCSYSCASELVSPQSMRTIPAREFPQETSTRFLRERVPGILATLPTVIAIMPLHLSCPSDGLIRTAAVARLAPAAARCSRLLVTSLLTALLVTGCTQQDVQTQETNFDFLTPCERDPEASRMVSEGLCGTITVFEDRKLKAGRTIDLNVMVIPALARIPKPDPVFFLAGGPGQSSVHFGPFVFERLRKVRMDRDLVFVDQRGTGKSNPLDCVPDSDAFENLDRTIEQIEALEIKEMQACLAGYDADPRLYTTSIAMDDLNEVRQTLGYNEINLFGISYGTRAALEYIRRHEATVRSAILDGVAPPTMVIPARVAIDAQAAFEQLLADCKKQDTCRAAFPDLSQHFDELIARLGEDLTEVTFTHPRTGETLPGKINATVITRYLRGLLYDRTISRLIPFAIEAAWGGNYEPMMTLAFAFYGEESPMSVGMTASVLCAEDMTRSLSPNDAGLDFDNTLYRTFEKICAFWPRGTVDAGYFDPVTTDLPVLLTSGKLDPITPPAYAIEAAQTLSRYEHVIVPGVGHSVVGAGCMPDVVLDFLETADPANLSTACAVDITRPAFFTSHAGPVMPALADAMEDKP